jgi:hypothetical protein
VASKEIERGKGTRGRGAEGKQNVAVMAESTPLEDIETGKKEKHVRYFKARVLDRTSAMAGKEKYARQPERKIFPRPHGQNAGIGRNGNRRLPLLKNPIPRGRTAENGRAATRGMDRKGLKTGGWKNRKGRSEVKKGRRMAMPSIKRDYAVGRPKPKQTLPGPGKVCPWIISQYRNQSQTRH